MTDRDEEEFRDEPSSRSSVPPEGQRQHKYSTKDMKPERPWRKWCWMAICCLLTIAIMIIISLYMQKLFDPPEDEDWSDDDKVNVTDDDLVGVQGELTGTSSQLPKTMDFIEDVCSETRLGEDDKKECEQACEPAKDCCDPFTNGGNSTCFETESAGCFTYSKCHSLDGFIDAAHNDLDRICNKASLEINREECVLACSAMECCYMDDISCVTQNFPACLDYAACQNLRPDSIDVAPKDLDERCAKQEPTCKRDCREALCCSDVNSKCYRENFLSCLSYASCTGNSDTTIMVAPINSEVPPPPDDLANVCSTKRMKKDGAEPCLRACEPAECCWKEGAQGCFGNDPLGCTSFQICKVLQRPEYLGTTLPPVSSPNIPPITDVAAETEVPATNVAEDTQGQEEEQEQGGEEEETEAPTGNTTETGGSEIQGRR